MIRKEFTDEKFCILIFDRPDSTANIFDRATLKNLGEHLDELHQANDLAGVILTSAKDSIFVAGADVHSLQSMNEADLEAYIELGQATFQKLADLKVPTVAAIHGACVGGGFEVALACRYRVASDDKATKIGLPETQLGILPAWGGSTRLPRLIGLPRSLDIILGGKVVSAQQALRYGMIDMVVPKELLIKAARLILEQKRPSHKPSAIWNMPVMKTLAATLVGVGARKQVLKKTKGNYPAVTSALEVAVKGVSSSEKESLARERRAVLKLAQTGECKNLMHIFFLQERSRKLKVTDEKNPSVHHVAVIGAGIMGGGIAQWSSARGFKVLLRDVNANALAQGMARIRKTYTDAVKRHIFSRTEARSAEERISPVVGSVSLKQTDLVIEAAVEKMEIKKKIFQELEQQSNPRTILATNTSALSISEIASVLQYPQRVVGIHFFNPVHRMPLVEVVQGERTDPAVIQAALRFVQKLGKSPVLVKDSPGFLVNRILLPYMVEAVRLFDMGANAEDIDRAMLDFGMPMGPLRLIDEVGVDIAADVAATLADKFAGRMYMPSFLTRMMGEKFLGRKNGKGFYVYNGKRERYNSQLDAFREANKSLDISGQELQRRMVLLMVNEAARCLEEGIVENAGDVDFGMIMGTGFPPFRGGVLRFADSVGISKIVDELSRISEVAGGHFEPCDLLKQMANEVKSFYEN